MNSQRLDESDGIATGTDIETDGNTSMNTEKMGASNDPEQAGQPESGAVDVPPDGGYGWVCVACTFVINGHTWGINSVESRPVTIGYLLTNGNLTVLWNIPFSLSYL